MNITGILKFSDEPTTQGDETVGRYIAAQTKDVCLAELTTHEERDDLLNLYCSEITRCLNSVIKKADGQPFESLEITFRNIRNELSNPDCNIGFFRLVTKLK